VSFVSGSSTQGYMVDGWGGLHPFGGAASVTSLAYYPGLDIVRSIWETP
jgi:hypothetical protein